MLSMNHCRYFFCLFVFTFFSMSTTHAMANMQRPIHRSVAITVDDLPWQNLNEQDASGLTSESDAKRIATYHAKLIQAMKRAKAPVIGFVNEGKLYAADDLQSGRLQMLDDWLSSGFTLGNHTYGHVSLHDVGMSAYQVDILKGEQQLKPLMAKYHQVPQWFRHPYLRAGQSMEDKQALSVFLTQHGYRIAPVTHDNSEWIWAFAYRRVLQGNQDKKTLAKLRKDYVPYMMERMDYYEQQSIALLGYNLPHVLLIHANELNAVAYGDLMKAFRKRGYHFITLEQALQDPAYLREDGYTGKYGPSWIHRWARAEKKPREFYGDEPKTPDWVMKLAQVDSE
jgi:peptidoglycan/xylan/chitin deacetylase (PgdA/CDA1 family)